MVTKFEIGKTYETSSICDSECIYSFTVIKRTDKTVWLEDRFGEVVARRVYIYDDSEAVKPHGSYSMASTLRAERDLVESAQEVDQETEVS